MQIRWLRYLIEFSSILVLAFLWPILTDVTLAKQFNIDHASSQASTFADDVAQEAAPSLEQSLPSSIMTDQKAAKENPYKDYLKFTPESLDFGYHPISVPVIETVYVENVRPDEANIQLLSISGNTEHFHCSFFEEKLIAGGTNTSFQVVFLARQEGLVNNTLYIHSSVGSFMYRVSAVGEASPFRVRPLIGARVPLNASFASLIYIYNPFSTPLQLTEMYTSGGGLHLELPENEYEAPSSLWNVPPYESRPIMKAHFLARIASNYTSYIRIRTNASDVQLMLPVEVEVSNSPGLYTPLDTLDFGVIRSQHDSPRVLPIQVINAAMKYIYVHNIVVTPLSAGLSVENFEGPVKLPPRSSSPTHIADLVLDPQQFTCSGLCVGKVLVKSKNNQYKLAIPFVARMIQGELYFNSTLSHFLISDDSTTEQRPVTVENRFDSPVLVHEIELPDEAKPYFKLTLPRHHRSMPIVLPVGKPYPLLSLEFTPSPQLSHFSSVFRLLTNYSSFELPLFAYRGRLDLFIPNSADQTQMDLGLVGLNEQKSATFVVSNHNPIGIKLIYWQCNLPSVSIEFVGTSHGNISAINQQRVSEETKNLSRSEATLLAPEHFAVFRVHVNRLAEEGPFAGRITLTTPFESLAVPLRFKVLRGSLKASKVILPRTFPGRIVTAMLQVKSNYTSPIRLKGAFVEPKDERFKIKLPTTTTSSSGDEHQQQPVMMIKPGDDNHVLVQFDASAGCLQRTCYTALDIEKEVGHLWLLGTSLYSDTAYIDRELYRLLRNQWTMLTDSDKSPAVNIRLQVDGFGSFITEAQAQLYWPRISNKLSIRFPSVRIGRSTTKELLVENPADRAILIQALNVVDYPTPDVLLAMMSNHFFHQQWSKGDLESFEECIRSGAHKNRSAVFTFVNSSSSGLSAGAAGGGGGGAGATASSSSNSNRINEWLGVAPNANSYTMILPPGARQRLAITFQPKDERNFTSLLVLRNNLTVIDVVMLRGEGGRGLLKLNSKLPNTDHSLLLFEFTEKQLERKCRAANAGGLKAGGASSTALEKVPSTVAGTAVTTTMSSLMIRQKFTVVNSGRMSMQIRSFLIDGLPCEGHGFHISHCDPQFLTPNQSFDIEMVYSPDFTTPYVSHELTVLVDDDVFPGGQKYQLIAKIPQKYLRQCLELLPRPLWENVIYYMLVTMALFVLFLSIVVAISDAHRITSYYEMENSQDDLYNQMMEEKQPEEGASTSNGTLANSHSNGSVPRKSTDNGHANGTTSNGKAGQSHHQQQQQQQSTKFRNRKGNKGSNGNSGGNSNNSSNSTNSGKSSFRPSNLIPAVSSNASKQHEHPSTSSASRHDDELNNGDKTGDWTNTTLQSRKKALIRQDSNSSEHSQRSTDTSTSTSSSRNNIDKSDGVSDLMKDRSRKSATDSSTEALQQGGGGGGTSSAKLSISNDAKQLKGGKADQVLDSKKANKKGGSNNNSSKAASGKAGGKGSDKSSSSKLLEKTASVDGGTSTKSSSESLNFIPNIDSGNNAATKARSATLPLTSKGAPGGGGGGQPENVSISQSDMSGGGHHFDMLNGRAGYNVVVTKSQTRQQQQQQQLLQLQQLQQQSSSSSGHNKQQQPTTVLGKQSQFDLSAVGSNNSSKSNVISKLFPDVSSVAYNNSSNIAPSQLYFDMAQPNNNSSSRDIWDSPITSFDSELAMNMIVKQTEAFATNDPDTGKFGSASNSSQLYPRQLLGQAGLANRKVIAPPPGLPIPAAHQRHDSGSSNSNNSANMTRFSEDKWEIGEWSNELANANARAALKSRTIGTVQQLPQPIGDLKFGANSSASNSYFSTGDPIRDLQFQQAAAKSRNFSRLGIKDFEGGRPGGGSMANSFGRTAANSGGGGGGGSGNASPSIAVGGGSSFKSAFPVGHPLGSVIGSIPSAPGSALVGANHSSTHSSLASSTTLSSSSSLSSTFSPVIGRPNPPQPTAAAVGHSFSAASSSSVSSSAKTTGTTSRLFGSTSSSSNGSQASASFSDAFNAIPSPLDANFSLKSSLLSDIDCWSMQPTSGGNSSVGSGSVGHHHHQSSSTLTDNKLNSLFSSWNAAPAPPTTSAIGDGMKKKKATSIDSPTTIFDFGGPSDPSSVWGSSSSPTSNWATFDKAPQKQSSKAVMNNAGDNKAAVAAANWPSPPNSAGAFDSAASRASVSSVGNGENRSWSPFDDYRRLNPSPSSGLFEPISSSAAASSSAVAAAAGDVSDHAARNVIFEPSSSVFELFGGKSPWSPLGSPYPLGGSATASKNSSDTPAVIGAERNFPPNPSPTLSHKSSSSNHSSSNHSSN